MPFPFTYVCDLLERLDKNLTSRTGFKTPGTIISDWFRAHQATFARNDNLSGPLLSTLLPEKRTDRVYNLKEKRLQTIIGRALGLGRSRLAELSRWMNPEAGVDLAGCVEMILKETPNPVTADDNPVTVEEIDELLHAIAATCRFSSPAVRRSAAAASRKDDAKHEFSLGDLYRRLSARDAKWLTRLILKNYEPVLLNIHSVCASYHPLLPVILKVQDDLAVAGQILDKIRRDETVTGQTDLAQYLKPTLGVKVGRQMWFKARSIKHCLSMLQGRVSCEEKLDGEYCQVHIDLSKGYDCIQIFSKSGKDSTKDRIALHGSIRKSLRLGQPSCPVKKNCILEGELVVWSDKESKVLDFHKIRKHVSRSGSFLGTDRDSQPHPWEHLMIVYYDVLMVDDESLLAVKHSERFQRLKGLITLVPGRSAVVQREIIDCSRRSATSDLRRAFAKCITACKEGLVLKPDEEYFDFGTSQRPYCGYVVKLKKEYIGCFGEIGDFAVVGARYDATKARTYNIPGLKWTHFYVACLENKEEVLRFGKQPRFVVTNVVELNSTQLQAFKTAVNPETVRPEDNSAFTLRIEPGVDAGKRPSVLFPSPPVFDIRCFSFDKEGNTGFWGPRFPSVAKIHCDRTYHDVISFTELQEMAAKEKEAPLPDDSQELLGWIARLESLEPSSQLTVSTTATEMTPSPQRTLSQIVRSENRKRPLEESPSKANIQERAKLRKCSDDLLRECTPTPEARGPGSFRESTENCDTPLQVSNSISRSDTHLRGGTSASTAHAGSQRKVSTTLPTRLSSSFHEVSSRTTPAPAIPTRPSTASARIDTTTGLYPTNPTAPSTSSSDQAHPAANQCVWFSTACRLARYSILLSPCIANYPYVTEDLLSAHGVTRFFRDPNDWASDPTAQNNKIKLILVDARRRQATVDFLRTVEAAAAAAAAAAQNQLQEQQQQQQTNNGSGNGPRRVPVYDWHVLQELKSAEEKHSKDGGEYDVAMFDPNRPQSVWRKYLVGLV
ncbi:hypothetical protein VTJ04DRAFT_6536 [Mycothermus thermophilus]|uniref:uncharacterized protein n=1 Tax=Humicola insolens TaxID=85995 RepID=UPI003743DCC8